MSSKPAHEESSVTSCSVVHPDLPELEQRNIEASELVPVFKHSICILLRIGWPDSIPHHWWTAKLCYEATGGFVSVATQRCISRRISEMKVWSDYQVDDCLESKSQRWGR